MSYGFNTKKTIQSYLELVDTCEVCHEPATEVHHIFGKRTADLKGNPLNFVSLCHDCHVKAETTQVQLMADKIFAAKMASDGTKFTDFADKVAHKTWSRR